MASEFWRSVGAELSEEAADWWTRNEALIGDLEAKAWEEITEYLVAGEPSRAAIEIAMRMDGNTWRAYLAQTTAQLTTEAQRLSSLYRALASLSSGIAKAIGAAIMAAR